MKENTITLCQICNKAIVFIQHNQWAGTHYETLDEWWAHFVSPDDGHEGVPKKFGINS